MNDKGPPREPDEPHEPHEKRMTFGEHLEELRSRLIISLVVIGVLFILALIFQDQLFHVFTHPYDIVRARLSAKGPEHDPGPLSFFKPTEAFVQYMEVAIYFAILFGAPVLLYQMWQFIAAGLYAHEKRWVGRIVPFSLLLFAAGLAFGYFVLMPMALGFLISYSDVLKAQIRVDEYSSLLVTFILLMGAVFQLPLLMVVLDRVGIVKLELFTRYRKMAILINFIVAAVVTPPDVVSQLMVVGPLVLLYEIGIIVTKMLRKRARPPTSLSPPAPATGG